MLLIMSRYGEHALSRCLWWILILGTSIGLAAAIDASDPTVQKLGVSEFAPFLQQAAGGVVVEMYAEGCSWCTGFHEAFNEAARAQVLHHNVSFVRVDVQSHTGDAEAEQGFLEKWGLNGVPCVLFVERSPEQGALIHRLPGPPLWDPIADRSAARVLRFVADVLEKREEEESFTHHEDTTMPEEEVNFQSDAVEAQEGDFFPALFDDAALSSDPALQDSVALPLFEENEEVTPLVTPTETFDDVDVAFEDHFGVALAENENEVAVTLSEISMKSDSSSDTSGRSVPASSRTDL